MSVNRQYIRFYSRDLIDKIIGVFTGTINVGAPTSVQGSLSTTDIKFHGFNDSTYFKGIFTTDGGTTWNDFGAQTPNLSGSFPTFDTADCNATIDASNANITATSSYDYFNSTSQAYTISYKILLIAKNVMAHPINPLVTAENVSLTSDYNYQKIALQSSIAISVADFATGSVSFLHGLGYVPRVRAWWFASASPSICRPLKDAGIQTKITSTTVTFYVDNAIGVGSSTVGNIEYRVYYND